MRLRAVVCETLLSQMMWHLKHIRMIAAMYVSSAHLLSILYAKILHGGWLHRRPRKNPQNCQNRGVEGGGRDGHFHSDGSLPRTIQYMWPAITIFDVMGQK